MEIWNAPIELSLDEKRILELSKKRKLWLFFRNYRHLILDEEFCSLLMGMYSDSPSGRPPEAPEQLILAMLLQAAFDVPDHEVPTLTVVDQRWQMVLDCWGATTVAFSQGTVFNFRERVRRHGIMDRLLEKTVLIARETKGFSHKKLRTLFDSSPLLGAGRVEDTFNLLGRAIVELVEVAAQESGEEVSDVANALDVTVVGASSVKSSLDIDWRNPDERLLALNSLINQFRRIEEWLSTTFISKSLEEPPIAGPLAMVRKIIVQNIEPEPNPPTSKNKKSTPMRLVEGVAADRIISLSDQDMRHGRKSKSKVFAGFKRHIATDADIPELICAVKLLKGNATEQSGAEPLMESIKKQELEITELHIDRGYLPATQVVKLHERGCPVITKPPTPKKGERFNKADFSIDFKLGTITCPNSIVIPLKTEQTAHRFSKKACQSCPQKRLCITDKNRYGRTINLHPQEEWYREMSDDLATTSGRAKRRERIPVEHALARVGAIQGIRARFHGLEKNQFDLERTAVINNFYILGRLAA
jgi:hypothetical protein